MGYVEVEHLRTGKFRDLTLVQRIETGVKLEATYEFGYGITGEVGAFDTHIQKKIEPSKRGKE